MPGYVDRSQQQFSELRDYDIQVTKEVTSRNNAITSTSNPPQTPPSVPSDIANKIESPKSQSRRRRSGPRREWDAVAARIAARTAHGRHTAKGASPTRVEKPTPRPHKPGLSIDTNVAKKFGDSPQQLFPKISLRQQATGYQKLDDKHAQVHRAAQGSVKGAEPPHYSNQNTLLRPSTVHRSTDLGVNLVSKFSPETPTIVITPALDSKVSSFSGPRIASSIYSRPTAGVTPPTNSGSVPPLPQNFAHVLKKSQPCIPHNPGQNQLAQQNARESNGTAFEEDVQDKTIGRVTSTGTLFEEDQTPLTAQLHNVQRANDMTLDTANLSTPHRSRGWWDLIKTPFERSKSFSSKFGKSPTDGEKKPEVPAIPPMPLYAHLHDKNAAVGQQPVSLNGLGLKMFPRATHNSQALRRLESKDQLQVQTVPPMPIVPRGSGYSTFSPNDREVPILLSISPIDPTTHKSPDAQQHNQEQTVMMHSSHTSDSTAVSSTVQFKSSPHTDQTPESMKSEFSPVGQITSMGAVPTAKGVLKYPLLASTQSSNQTMVPKQIKTEKSSARSSFIAEVVKQTPISTPAPTFRPGPQGPIPYFAPPPAWSQKETPKSKRFVGFNPPPSVPQARFSTYSDATARPKRKGMKQLLSKHKKDPEKGEKSTKKKKRRRWCCCCCCLLFFILALIAIVLGVVLSRKHGQPASSTQATFLNITNFPPIPTGVLTVARPDLRTSVSGCVNPMAMWSCAVPKEQQDSIKPNDPDQPDFVFNIMYNNASTSTSPSSRKRLKSRGAVSGSLAAASWRANFLEPRDTETVFQPSPAPPTLDEQAFLGNTTDGNVAPFEGESTPFFISFSPPSQTNSRRVKRQDLAATITGSGSSATTTANSIPNLATAIPIPDVQPDGTAEPANLLPFPSYQPLRLYNRGKPDEHYGFYTYFERNIFLKSVSVQNASEQIMGDIPSDANGGSTFQGATARCTWRDTRFKVQIFTNMGNSTQLLPAPAGTAPTKPGTTTFVRPGTFPYPITITLDRHGGGLTTKMLFCYGMDDRGHIDINSRRFQGEDRGIGGQLVNPALGPFVDVNVTQAQGGPGGIDGGTGGCSCEWANWLNK